MPIYDMTCKKCNYVGEHLLKNYKETLQCPNCGEEELVRKESFQFNMGRSSKQENSISKLASIATLPRTDPIDSLMMKRLITKKLIRTSSSKN